MKSISFGNRLRNNLFGYGYGQIVTVINQIFLVPFFLKYWGVSLYADWLVLTGLPTLLILLDFGVAQASANKATMEAGAQHWENVKTSLQTALVFTVGLGLVIVALVAMLNYLIDWQLYLNLKVMNDEEAGIVLFLISMCVIVNLLGGPIDGWYRVIDKTALGAFLLSNRRMLDFVFAVVVLVLGGGAIELAISMILGQLVMLYILVKIAIRNSPCRIIGVKNSSMREFKEILRPAIAYMSFPLVQSITLQGGVQILNQVASAEVLVGYTMARTLARLIIQIGVLVNNAAKPEISRLIGAGHSEEASKAIVKISVFVFSIALLCYLFYGLLGGWVIEKWSEGAVYVPQDFLWMLGSHAVLNVAWFVPAAFLIAKNQHVKIAVAYTLSSLVTLILWVVLINKLNPVVGASVLLFVPELIMCMTLFFDKSVYAKFRIK